MRNVTQDDHLTSQEQLKWVQWKLWREKLIGVNSNGEILVYSLLVPEGELMYKSEPYTVVLYKNPSWIFRSVVSYLRCNVSSNLFLMTGTLCSARAWPPGA